MTEIQPKTTHIGNVGGLSDLKEVTLTLDTNAYGDGDLLCNPIEIPNVFRGKYRTAILYSVEVHDRSDQGHALDLCFTTASTSWGTVNDPLNVSDAIAVSVQHIVRVAASEFVDLINGRIAPKPNIGVMLKSMGGTSLYVAAVSRGTGTYAADGVVLKVGLLLD